MDQEADKRNLRSRQLEIAGRIVVVLVLGIVGGTLVEAYTGSPAMGGIMTLLIGAQLWSLLTLGDILDSIGQTKDAQIETLRRLDRGMTLEVRELKD